MRRKILLPAFFYLSGIIAFLRFYKSFNIFIFFLFVVAMVLACFYLKKALNINILKVVLLFIIFIVSIFNSYYCYYYSFGQLDQLIGIHGKYTFRVIKVEEKKSSLALTGQIMTINDRPLKNQPKVLVNVYQQEIFDGEEGSIIDAVLSINGQLETPKPNTNPHCFNYQDYLLSKGIKYCISTNGYRVEAKGDTIRTKLYDLKEEFLSKSRDLLSEENTAFIKGVCFGDKGDIDEDSLRHYQENGTAHILAVSGLHIGLIYLVLKKILYKKHRLLFYVSLIFLLLSYGIITQWSVSVVRATLMIGTSCLSFVLEKRYDLTAATVFVALVILVNNPFQVLSIGFRMSFLAVLSLPFFSERIKQLMMRILGQGETREKLSATLATVLSIQLGLGLYTAYVFNYFSPLSFVLNIPTVLLVSYLVPLVLGQFFVFSVTGMIPFAQGTGLLYSIIDWINKVGWLNGKATMAMESNSSIIVGFALLTLFYVFSEEFQIRSSRKEKGKIILTIGLILLIAIPIFYNYDDRFNKADVIFVDVGQGDCIHIRCDGRNYLLDGGGKASYDIGIKVLKPYLLKNGAKKLDGAMATHNHSDHYLGLCQLSQEFKIKNGFVSSGYLNDSEEISQEFRSSNLYFVNDTKKVNLGHTGWIEILWPDERARMISDEDENSVSLVFMVHLDGVRILVTGDIDHQCEKELVKKYMATGKLKADVLKVAHHGSKYSTCEEFLDQVKPKLSIISVGKNTYGHPSNAVITRLEAAGSKVYRTDEDGAVGIEIGRNSLKVLTQVEH